MTTTKKYSLPRDFAEKWVAILGFPKYEISNLGNVRSFFKPKPLLLKQCIRRKYLSVTLSNNQHTKSIRVHRLVALHFIKNDAQKPFVNHIDGNKYNNHVSNLEWCTCRENTIHAFKIGLRRGYKGAENKTAKKIQMCSVDGNTVRIFNSIREAVLNFSDGVRCNKGIIDCLKNRKSIYRGHIWKYA